MVAGMVIQHPNEPGSILVGRARELATLRERLEATLAGNGGLVLIGGEAGIGKTALAAALARDARAQGALVRAGYCYDLTETPPYGPWIEVLSQAPRPDRPALPPLGDAPEQATNQATLFVQVREFISALAREQPLVLLLEDLHWADPGSLDLLRIMARSAAMLPLLIVVTYRADELTHRHPLFTLFPLLVREARAVRLDLRRLELDHVRELIAARYRLSSDDEDRLVGYLGDRAEGNPLYIVELLRTLEEERLLQLQGETWLLGDLAQARVPLLLRQVIEARSLRLGTKAHTLLSVASVIGEEVSLSLWSAVSELSEETLLEVVETAVEARLLDALRHGEGVRFAHALIRETLYEGMLPPRRRAWHRRVAEALLAMPAPDPDAVAYHLQRAGDPRAAEWLIRAGERAQRAYALLTAAERFEAALQLLEAQGAPASERAKLLYRLARMRRYADPRQALGYLEDAIALAEEASDHALAAYIGCFRGSLLCTSGEIRGGLADLEAGVAAIDALSPDERGRLRALQQQLGDPPDEYHYRGALVSWLAIAGHGTEALALGAQLDTRPPAHALGTSGYANAWRGIASALATLGRPEEARQAYARASAAYRAVEHHYQVGNALLLELFEVVLPYRADDLAERRRLAQAAEQAWSRASGALSDLPPRFAWLPLLLIEGNWAEARELARAISAPGERTNWRPFARMALALLAREQGQPDLAWRMIREHLPAGPASEPGDAILLDTLPLQRLAATLALDYGNLELAAAWLKAHERWLDWSGAVLGRAEGYLGWAAYHRAAGKLSLARHHAEQALAWAEQPRQPLALLAAHRLMGELETHARRYDEAAAHLDAALALAGACDALLERALTLLALAELRRVTGQPGSARSLIEEARAICDPLGAVRVLALVDDLLTRIAGRTPPGAVAGLTPREIEVLRLVAEGLTDAQVAERLFLSPRTVSQHLRSIYNKLGVSSRAAATRFAIEHGLL